MESTAAYVADAAVAAIVEIEGGDTEQRGCLALIHRAQLGHAGAQALGVEQDEAADGM